MKTFKELKYKDRDPLETVKIIKDLFTSAGFIITENSVKANIDNPDIWSCALTLSYQEHTILNTKGKGLSKEFCLASGYAEIYERFANKLWLKKDFRFTDALMQLQYSKNNYWLNPDEILGLNRDLLGDNNLQQYFKSSAYNEESLYINFKTNNKPVLVPYTNLVKDDSKYYNPIVLTEMLGSNGMAAGNTIEEALVQGISELFEREGLSFISHHLEDQYYIISNDQITDPTLKTIINNFENNGNLVRIIDLSYNMGLPILCTFFINTTNNKFTYCLSSHPIFNIALERCLTEIVQDDIYINTIDNFDEEFSTLVKLANKEESILTLSETTKNVSGLLPESIILYAESKPINLNAFIDETTDISNKILLDYLIKLSNNLGIDIYYINNSICSNIAAVQLYCPQFEIIGMPVKSNEEIINSAMVNSYKMSLKAIKDFYTCNNISDINLGYVNSLFNPFNDNNILDTAIVDAIKAKQENNFQTIDSLIPVYELLLQSEYKDLIIKYITLFKYRMLNKSKLEVKNIFDYIGTTFTDEEWNNCINISYLIANIIMPEYHKVYSKEFFNNLLSLYIK